MTRITIDDALRAKLVGQDDLIEICDQHGSLLGYFRPIANQPDYQGVQPPISEDELRRRQRESEVYTTTQVLDRLERS